MRRFRTALATSVLFAIGCSSAATPAGGPGPSGTGAPAPPSPPPSPASSPPPRSAARQVCPESPPIPGVGCDEVAGLQCEYGGDAYGNCPREIDCDQPHFGSAYVWIDRPAPSCTPLPAGCPATKAEVVEGSSCTVDIDTYDSCEYPEAACACVACRAPGGDAVGIWKCRAWSDIHPDCPVKPRAHLGAACSIPGLRCDYNRCWNEWHSDVSLSGPIANLECSGGAWQFDLEGTPEAANPNPCPMGLPACP